MESVFTAIAPHLSDETILTDVGSSKASVVEAAGRAFGKLPANFVPAHPIAGTEKNGVDASVAELFQQHRVIITPTETTSPSAILKIRAMWEQAGAIVTEMPIVHHDEILAATSHLPHLLAFTLVDTLASVDDKKEIFEYAAGGFRDFTRIASSDPLMWHDICVHNEAALLKILDRFNEDLGRLRQAIADKDGEYLLQVFSRAKAARDRFARPNGKLNG
jgi:prephenate dehydrogenase